MLINTPEEYEQYHLLPGWYDDFKDETAESVWITGNNIEDIAHASRYLEGSYIVKDYVKSRKHEWYDACFIENIYIEAYRRAAEQRKQEPGDKYHIGCLINYDSSVEKIVKVVSRVFSEAFEPQDFTVEKCMNVAVNIRKALDDGASIYWSS